jgi:hypothetical protein
VVAGARPVASILIVKSRCHPVTVVPRITVRLKAPSAATSQRTSGVALSGAVTRVHRMTLSVSGSPLATPCRKIFRGDGTGCPSFRTSRTSPAAMLAPRNSRRDTAIVSSNCRFSTASYRTSPPRLQNRGKVSRA